MTNITVNKSVDPNHGLLDQELLALGLGTYQIIHPVSYPGDMVIKYENTLTSAQQTSVSNTVSNHVETGTTAEQNRVAQDTTDLNDLRTKYDSWATLTSTEKEDAYKKAIRMALRAIRTEDV